MNPVASQPTGSSDAAAALKGASLAFQNRKSPAPTTPVQRRDNGALTAATASSSAASRSVSPSKRLAPQSTGGSTVTDMEGTYGYNARHGGSVGGNGLLQARVDTKSPSFIAATLAASRSASPSPMQRTPRRVGSVGGASTTSASDTAVDSVSIPPTTSLISMFERGKDGDPVKRMSPRRNPTESSEESLPETWHAPVKLPGIAKTHAVPNRAAMASDESLDERVRAPVKTAHVNPQLRSAQKTVISEMAGSPSPGSKPQLKMTPASPPQQLKPYTKSSPAVGKVSQEAVSAPSPSAAASTRAPTVAEAAPKPTPKPEPKPKPQLAPSASKPAVLKQKPTIPSEKASEKPSPRPQTPDMKPKPAKPKPAPLNPIPRVISHSTPEVLSPKPTRPVKPALQVSHPSPAKSHASTDLPQASTQKQRPPTPPKPRGTASKPAPTVTSTRFVKGTPELGMREAAKVKRSAPMDITPKRSDTMSTDDSFVSASSYQSGDRLSPPSLPPRAGSAAPIYLSAPISPTRGTPRPHNSSMSSLGLSNMTNAIMAGSLAAARLTPHNTGSSLPPPSLPKRHKSPHLRETMRKPTSAELEEPDRHKSHKHKLSRGKHAHHEGSRKKWRDQVTPRERKRYEAVWASNRGALLPPTTSAGANLTTCGKHRDTTDVVVSVIVRELWRRSRLPEDELAEVWDLVDRDKSGWLGRQEFVVGMWLIDQRLKGRKIPRKVSDSVWGSANGVTVIKPKSK
ncbi:cytoskeletal-regulatory complex EF hand domain-containing protein [Sarocladium implicatum]|nr:cytoskeletal-regulatory complex EF hand domain-containing protein [Sarocladium implicatum]